MGEGRGALEEPGQVARGRVRLGVEVALDGSGRAEPFGRAKVQQRRGELENSKAMAERALALEKDPAKRAVLEELANPKPPEPAPPKG